jgi:hypothetical protein
MDSQLIVFIIVFICMVVAIYSVILERYKISTAVLIVSNVLLLYLNVFYKKC